MGFRYRKSINLGGGFRINLSKSGIGYSWGVKGYRVTKTANGGVRRTVSIPGTGISHVTETSGGNHENRQQNRQNESTNSNLYDQQDIENTNIETMCSDGVEDILKSANRALLLNTISTACIVIFFLLSCGTPIFLVLLAIAVAAKIYVKRSGVIDLEYEIDEEELEHIKERMRPIRHLLTCDKVWRIMQSGKVIDRKYSSVASSTVRRVACKVSDKTPFPFRSSVSAVCVKSGKENLIFLPDKLFIMKSRKIGALSYWDIESSAQRTRFVESESVPNDAQIVGTTWKYVNKSGGPDKRFKDNRELPICLYGELALKSPAGLNTDILFSNPNIQ